MITDHDTNGTIIISDLSLLRELQNDDSGNAEIVFNFLSWKESNKRIITIPRLFQGALQRAEANTQSPELGQHFESFFSEADIGLSDKNPDAVEFITILENISILHKGKILVYTDNSDLYNELDAYMKVGAIYADSSKLVRAIYSEHPAFYDEIFEKYFDTSGV